MKTQERKGRKTMKTISDIFLASVDRASGQLSPFNALIDNLVDRLLPHATAKACHGGAITCPGTGCDYAGTCQYCKYFPGGNQWSWAYLYRVVYQGPSGACNGSCWQCGLDDCYGGTYSGMAC